MQITLYKKVYHQLTTLPENNREPKRAVILFAGKKGNQTPKNTHSPTTGPSNARLPEGKENKPTNARRTGTPEAEKQPSK